MRKYHIVVLLLAAFVPALIRADVIVDNLNQTISGDFGPIGSDANTNDFLIGQEFTMPAGGGSYTLDKIILPLSPTNVDVSGSVTVSIWEVETNSGNPTNQIAVVASQLVENAQNVAFIPSSPILLSAGESYYVVASPTTAEDSGLVDWAYPPNADWTGLGVLGNYADTSLGDWENYPEYPQSIRVEATPALNINYSGGNTVLSWPPIPAGYTLGSTTNLASPNWELITNSALVGDVNVSTNSFSDSLRFFRLHQIFAVNNLDQTVDRYYGPIGTNSSEFLIAQEFTLPSDYTNYTLNKVTLLLNGNGNITVSIWNVGPDNNPTNEIATVSSEAVTNEGNVDFTPSSSITLPSGNYYVVTTPTTAADNGLVNWAYTDSDNWFGFGTLGFPAQTDPTSGLWENFADNPIQYPQQMSVEATPTP